MPSLCPSLRDNVGSRRLPDVPLALSSGARSHDMILIDELHRNGSLGVGQGLFGGLQIGKWQACFFEG